jgi:hypothetical protein
MKTTNNSTATRTVNTRSLRYLRGSAAKGYTYSVDAKEIAEARQSFFSFEGSGSTRKAAEDAALAAAKAWAKEVDAAE